MTETWLAPWIHLCMYCSEIDDQWVWQTEREKISHYSLFERLGIKGGINSRHCGYTRLKRSIHLSIHPFPSTHPRLGCVKQGVTELPRTSRAFQHLIRDPEAFPCQMGYVIPPVNHGSTPEVFLLTHAWHSQRGWALMASLSEPGHLSGSGVASLWKVEALACTSRLNQATLWMKLSFSQWQILVVAILNA